MESIFYRNEFIFIYDIWMESIVTAIYEINLTFALLALTFILPQFLDSFLVSRQ